MITGDIIFQLIENTKINAFEERFDDLKGRAKRLYDTKEKVDTYRLLNPTISEEFPEDENLFIKRIYKQMEEVERRLYRTYIIVEDDKQKSSTLLGRLNHDSKQGNAIVTYAQNSFIYEFDNRTEPAPELKSKGVSWGVERMQCIDSWKFASTKGGDVVVAVIDTGVDYNHDYLRNRIKKFESCGSIHFGRNFVDDGQGPWDPMDLDGHGTRCAGIIAGEDNPEAIVGVAPGAKLMAIRISGAETSKLKVNQTDTPLCAKAIEFAVLHGAHVLSNSWALAGSNSSEEDKAIQDSIAFAVNENRILVFAAGNTSPIGVDITQSFPANMANTISVASTDIQNNRATDSNWGTGVTIAAPGYLVLTLRNDSKNGFVTDSGTSMACPHIAGLVALLLGIRPELPVSVIKTIIVRTGVPIYLGPHHIGQDKLANAFLALKPI